MTTFSKVFSSFLLLVLLSSLGCIQNEKSALSSIEHPAPPSSQFPFLYAYQNTLYMSWLSHHQADNTYSLNYSRYEEGRWNSPQTISRDSSWFVNWADFPSVVAGNNGPIAAHWLDKIPGGPYAYNVNISMAGSSPSWSPPLTPHRDSTATEHGFVSMVEWDEQAVLAVWLDGRQSAHSSEADYFNLENAMTLRGALISRSGEVMERFLIDEAVCDCCPTSLVKTTEGAVVAYRNRTDEEVRDIYSSRFNGKEWSSPEAVHQDEWEIGACPVNGPKLAASNSGVIVSWFTSADDTPAVKAATSTDYGQSFNQPVTISKGRVIGRVGAAYYQGVPYVSWMEKEEGQAYIKLKAFTGDSSIITIAAIDESRQSGFPQLAALRDKLIVAWTDISNGQPQIKMRSYTP